MHSYFADFTVHHAGIGVGMYYSDLDDFIKQSETVLAKGPVGLIFIEDDVEIDSTVAHHLKIGFRYLVIFIPDEFKLKAEDDPKVHRVSWSMATSERSYEVINRVIAKAPHNTWLYYCYNSEYLFYPFSESRTVGELVNFHSEERRRSMLTYVVDAYANDLDRYPNAVSLADTYIDKAGYFALARLDPNNHNYPKERQLNLFGGVHWRYEEHIPENRHRIDRISIFRTQEGLEIYENHTFNEEEYNTYSCPWHNNLTASIISFRTAKALKQNPASSTHISSFMWHNSIKFRWNAAQLLDLGFIEPGQWF